jgi:hypothetical protein
VDLVRLVNLDFNHFVVVVVVEHDHAALSKFSDHHHTIDNDPRVLLSSNGVKPIHQRRETVFANVTVGPVPPERQNRLPTIVVLCCCSRFRRGSIIRGRATGWPHLDARLPPCPRGTVRTHFRRIPSARDMV